MVQVGDMYYAWAKDPEITLMGGSGGVLTATLKYLLEKNIVDAVLAVKKGADLYDPVPVLIYSPDKIIETAGSLHFGTPNVAKIVEKYLDGADSIRIAVTTKPCDAMNIIELVKRGRINKENLFMLGINCGGTLSPISSREMIDEMYKINPDSVLKEEIAEGKLILEIGNHKRRELSIDDLEKKGYGRRSNCRRCVINIPQMTDIVFGNWGVTGSFAGKATFVEVLTEKGAQILEAAFKGRALYLKEPLSDGIEARGKIDKIMVNLARKWQSKDFRKEKGEIINTFFHYLGEFSKCIKCFGCRESCPLCYCEDCTLDLKRPEWLYGGEIPPESIFHLERLLHVAGSCTNCGQCEDVCPVDIPLALISHSINSRIQDLFGYHPGLDPEKPLLSYLFIMKGSK